MEGSFIGDLKTVGMIGGMGWISTINYYREINRLVENRTRGKNAEIVLYSLDFSHILALEQQQRWGEVGIILSSTAKRLQDAGAKGLVICSNTAHRVAETIEQEISIPIIHVVDTAAAELKKNDISTIGLLGTQYILKDPFYADRLRSHGIDVIIPDISDIEKVNRIIYRELARELIKDESRDYLYGLVETLLDEGAKGIVLGCTELPDVITQAHVPVPLFNTLKIHMNAVCDFIVGDEKKK